MIKAEELQGIRHIHSSKNISIHVHTLVLQTDGTLNENPQNDRVQFIGSFRQNQNCCPYYCDCPHHHEQYNKSSYQTTIQHEVLINLRFSQSWWSVIQQHYMLFKGVSSISEIKPAAFIFRAKVKMKAAGSFVLCLSAY